jgi:hypothetical protein
VRKIRAATIVSANARNSSVAKHLVQARIEIFAVLVQTQGP